MVRVNEKCKNVMRRKKNRRERERKREGAPDNTGARIWRGIVNLEMKGNRQEVGWAAFTRGPDDTRGPNYKGLTAH